MQLPVQNCLDLSLVLPKFSPYRNEEFSLYRKLYATEIKVDYVYNKCEAFIVFRFNPENV